MSNVIYHHADRDIAVVVETYMEGTTLFHAVEMSRDGETWRMNGIKFVMDFDQFDTFTYDDWANYFDWFVDECVEFEKTNWQEYIMA